jgi:hypothetical protein
VILPDNWEIVRQSALSANNSSALRSSNPIDASPTTPRQVGPGGITSRNPFSSPIRGRKPSPQKETFTPSRNTDYEASEQSAAGMICPCSSLTRLTAEEIPITWTVGQIQNNC